MPGRLLNEMTKFNFENGVCVCVLILEAVSNSNIRFLPGIPLGRIDMPFISTALNEYYAKMAKIKYETECVRLARSTFLIASFRLNMYKLRIVKKILFILWRVRERVCA